MTDRDKAQIIIQEVCKYSGMEFAEVLTKCRKREYVEPRQLICYLLRQLTPLSTGQIGILLRRDHSTVIAGSVNIERLIKYNGFGKKINTITDQINARYVDLDIEKWILSIPQF
jgi:chromosomal replication initiator protein